MSRASTLDALDARCLSTPSPFTGLVCFPSTRYIYQRETSPGVQDYLCNKLYDLPEHDIERHLSQFCQLIAYKPGGSLERVIVDLCSKSLRIAVKVTLPVVFVPALALRAID